MAMSILSTRLMPNSLPLRVLVASTASMSSSTPTTTLKNQDVATKDTSGVKKRESFRSMMASIFGGYVDPADPKDPPIPSEKVNFPDITEHATGEAKLFLLAFEQGFLDPYCNLPSDRNGRGTKDNPVTIESFSDERIVGCVCEDSQNFVRYTIVHQDEPKRCFCGHWLKLVPAPKFWEKIPKEDLITIPYFRDLESEGKLDKLLAGEDIDEQHHH